MSTQAPLPGLMKYTNLPPLYQVMLTRFSSLEAPKHCYQGLERDGVGVLPEVGLNKEDSGIETRRAEDLSHPRTPNGSSTCPPKEEMTSLTSGSLRDRVRCYTWTWFTMTMATGGVANVLFSSIDTQFLEKLVSNAAPAPYRSDWLRIVGAIVFLFNMGLFLMNAVLLTLKFMWSPGSFKASFTSQSESLFISACVSDTLFLGMIYMSCSIEAPASTSAHTALADKAMS
jgi:hypothetical protein